MCARVIAVMFVVMSAGCAQHSVEYTSTTKNQASPRATCAVQYGTMEGISSQLQQIADPDNSPREVYSLVRQIGQYTTGQMDSADYIGIGTMVGSGNENATIASLAEKFCERAAQEGGDLVFVYNTGFTDKPYSHTTPGMSTTNLYRTDSGEAFAITTHTPSRTVHGVYKLPYAHAMVYRRAPGIERTFEKIDQLDDQQLPAAMSSLADLMQDSSLTIEQMLVRWQGAVDELSKAATASGRKP